MKFLLIVMFFTLSATVSFSQPNKETLKTSWPEEYNWKIVSNQEDSGLHTIVFTPMDESIENWTILGEMMTMKNFNSSGTAELLNAFTQSALKLSSNTRYRLIEKDESSKNFW